MPGDTLIDILRRLLGADGQARPTPEAATYLLTLEFGPDDHRRIAELFDKCNEGLLTPEEQAEYAGYSDLRLLLILLHSKSRMVLPAQAAVIPATTAPPVLRSPKVYVHADDHGVLRVGPHRVSLDSVVIRYQEGDSPEAIRQDFPVLTLEQVYGAIAYYLANRAEVDAYLERQAERAEALSRQAEARPSPVAERLRAIKRSGATAAVVAR